MSDEETHVVRQARAMRLEAETPTVVFGLQDSEGVCFFFAMADADAYDFIRRLTRALFDDEATALQAFPFPVQAGLGS
jgi:hypothetical protein